ncbi:MAG: LPS assembly lipoprotein LptE [Qingshengfaniella sp.]
MSWSDPRPHRRQILAGLGLTLLAACQFRPVYGPGGTGSLLAGRVTVIPPKGSDAFTLAQHLEDRLGPPRDPRYTLTFQLRTETDRIAITASQDTNRFNLTGQADWRLTDSTTGAQLGTGQVQSFTAYSATGTTVATLTAEQDAADRLMRILSDKIMTELLVLSPVSP